MKKNESKKNEKQGRIHGNPVADGWAGAVLRKSIGIQKCDGRTDGPMDGPTDTARCPRLKKILKREKHPIVVNKGFTMLIKKVRRGRNIIADGWAGASNSDPHPHPHPTHKNTQKLYKMLIFPLFDSIITDRWTDEAS